jgi:hypothetical protein
MPHVFIQAGWTALMIAASKGDERICKLLLEHGADLTKNDCWGRTAIHFAAEYHHKTVLDQLLRYRPCHAYWRLTVDIGDSRGQTPLWFAAWGGHVDCVEALLVHGANPERKNDWNVSALDIAKRNGHASIVSMMMEALKCRSHRYVTGTISDVSQLKENLLMLDGRLGKCDKMMQRLEKSKKESDQSQLREIMQLRKELHQKNEEISELTSKDRRECKNVDPEKVYQAVISRGSDRWYSLCLEMGYASGQVDDITSGIPNHADKIRAVFNKKIDAVGESAAATALLEACRSIPDPIIGGVMDILTTSIH